MELQEINTSTREGRLLIKAIEVIDRRQPSLSWITKADVLKSLEQEAVESFGPFVEDTIQQPEGSTGNFLQQLAALINKNGLEQLSGTPDFILAQYLFDCLNAFGGAMSERATFFNEPLNKINI